MPGPSPKNSRANSGSSVTTDNTCKTKSTQRMINGGQVPLPSSLAACMECRSRKVKCNRELPKCSNCKKSGAHCEFPNPEKRSSQTKQLAEDVAAFNGRLSNIEKTLSSRMEMLTEIVSQTVHNGRHGSMSGIPAATGTCTPCSSKEDTPGTAENVQDESDPEIDWELGNRRTETPERSRSVSSGNIVGDGAAERYYGASSTYSHLIHARSSVKRILNGASQSERSPVRPMSSASSTTSHLLSGREQSILAEVQRKYDSLALPHHYQENFEAGDNKPIELPPRAILVEAVEVYLENETLEPPMFLRQTLVNAIETQYGVTGSDVDESWALCFSNIILRCSAWKNKTIHSSVSSRYSVEDLLSLLFANANRALRKVDQFGSLRLVNVQALYLLALVARDFIHFNMFERVFDRACQLSKQMGLHERGVLGPDPSPQDIERQNLLWLLYSVDKQRVFIRGSPCRIYLFECDIELPATCAEGLRQKIITANLKLNCVVEEVYRHLYSPKAARQEPRVRQQRFERLDRQLESLVQQVQPICAAADRASAPEKALALQLQYAFLITKLLIHSRSTAPGSKELTLDTARAALHIVRKLSSGSFIFSGGVVILERVFCNYSIIAFYEMFEAVIDEPSPTDSSDVALLGTAANALGLLSHPDRPHSYTSRLHKNLTWCVEVANLLQKAYSSTTTSITSTSISTPEHNANLHRAKVAGHFPPAGNLYQDHGSSQTTFQQFSNSSEPDFDGDLYMNESPHSSFPTSFPTSFSTIPTSAAFEAHPLQLATSSVPSSDYNHGLQPNVSTDILNMDAFGSIPGAGPSDVMASSVGHQPNDSIMENSQHFQQALQNMFDMGTGLDANFLMGMTGQGMPEAIGSESQGQQFVV